MSAEERAKYASKNICEECGLPIPACNELATRRIKIKRLQSAVRRIIAAFDSDVARDMREVPICIFDSLKAASEEL